MHCRYMKGAELDGPRCRIRGDVPRLPRFALTAVKSKVVYRGRVNDFARVGSGSRAGRGLSGWLVAAPGERMRTDG
jgi:hypothetical protein